LSARASPRSAGSCGTPLFWREANPTRGGAITEFCAGALQDDRNITVSRHIYVDDMPTYYRMAGDAERLTGVEYEKRESEKRAVQAVKAV